MSCRCLALAFALAGGVARLPTLQAQPFAEPRYTERLGTLDPPRPADPLPATPAAGCRYLSTRADAAACCDDGATWQGPWTVSAYARWADDGTPCDRDLAVGWCDAVETDVLGRRKCLFRTYRDLYAGGPRFVRDEQAHSLTATGDQPGYVYVAAAPLLGGHPSRGRDFDFGLRPDRSQSAIVPVRGGDDVRVDLVCRATGELRVLLVVDGVTVIPSVSVSGGAPDACEGYLRNVACDVPADRDVTLNVSKPGVVTQVVRHVRARRGEQKTVTVVLSDDAYRTAVEGYLTDAATGAPYPHRGVRFEVRDTTGLAGLLAPNAWTESDENGYYVLRGLPEAVIGLMFSVTYQGPQGPKRGAYVRDLIVQDGMTTRVDLPFEAMDMQALIRAR